MPSKSPILTETSRLAVKLAAAAKGLEIVAQIEPTAARGAVMADSIGPRRGSPAALTFTLKHAEALSDRVMRRKIER